MANYESWQLGYRSRGKGFRWKTVVRLVKRQFNLSPRSQSHFRQLKAVPSSTRQRSNLKVLASELEKALNEWLDSGDRTFQKIRDQLLKTFSTPEPVRLIIQTDQLELWQLPWELWHLVQEHSNVGVALSKREYAPVQSVPPTRSIVRILALLGDSTDINIQADLELLQQHLPTEAEIYAPKQMERVQLSDDLWTQSWDILFFAGHSSSRAGEGKLYLTADTYLTIPDLKYALSHAIAHGLKLAIFNSCDGLGLARDLADLQLPATIVMREPVPDEAAQKFLSYFFEAFARDGRSLYASVQKACKRLQGLEDKYPCVSWLPLISQNPAAPMLWWRSFLPVCPSPNLPAPVPPPLLIPVHRPKRLKVRSVLLISLVATCLVMGVRFVGYLQPLELKAFDHLMQLRPVEGADPRLLVVQITDEDEQRQNAEKEPGTGSLHDPTLQKLLTVLDKHQPAAIGIDIYRDQYKAVVSRLQDSHRTPIVGICQHPQFVSEPASLDQPKPMELSTDQVGFSNFSHDRDGVSRRHQLRQDIAKSRCQTSLAFSLQVALHYLQRHDIRPEYLPPDNSLKLKSTILRRIESHTGGYQINAVMPLSQYSILLNYRPYHRLDQIAESITLQQVLNQKFSPEAIKDKIILIGRVDEPRTTPYNVENAELLTPGVYLHAQAVSQILSAVLNDRRLLWWLPGWGDFLWVWIWTSVVGILTLQVLVARPWWLLVVVTAGTLLLLYLGCWLGMLLAAWLPLIPSGLALLLTSFGIVTSYYWQVQKKA